MGDTTVKKVASEHSPRGEMGQTYLVTGKGDSWLVPQGASHTYKILETFTALEATAPPGHLHDRDQAPTEQTG
jgi:hypothetical protein